MYKKGIIFQDFKSAPTRDGFGYGLIKAAESDKNIVAVCADLAESTRMHWFKEKFPERYVEIGVAEQNLATVASGLSAVGKIPFITSYASFSPGRNNEQIRTTIALNERPVKIIGSHAGVSVGPDGATHQALEDIALMRVLPNMTVIYPIDSVEAEKATIALAKTKDPTYLRLAREKTPIMTDLDFPFEIGKGQIMYESENPVIGIIAAGPLLYEAMKSISEFEKLGIGIVLVNMATIKPLDHKLLSNLTGRLRALITVEEHQVAGGLGSAIAEWVVENKPLPIKMIAVRNRFGQSGTPEELLIEYNLTATDIIKAGQELITKI